MENVTDALKMAAGVLIFVMALSISINAFGEARRTATTILNYRDREYDYTYVENNKTTQRTVSAETIIPSIYKAYKENYKIIFDFKSNDLINEGLYQKSDANSPTGTSPVYSIDLEKDVLGSDEQKEKFIQALLYGSKYPTIIEDFKKSGIFLKRRNFYDIIKEKTFTESLGVYYQEELQEQSDTPDANRTKKRVITYTENDNNENDNNA